MLISKPKANFNVNYFRINNREKENQTFQKIFLKSFFKFTSLGLHLYIV